MRLASMARDIDMASTCRIYRSYFDVKGLLNKTYRRDTETGMCRLALDDNDKIVRHWLIEQTKAIGCTVTVDQMGNIFAVRPGKHRSAAPTMMGSHLDTQPTGGRYDGILGVHAGLEVLRTLYENNYQTEGPVGLVNWTK